MNIVNMVTSFATPMVANKIASALGLPEAATRRVLSVAMPLLLAMLLKRGAAPGGSQALGTAIAGLGPKPLDSLGKLFQGEPSKAALTAAAHGGGDIVSSLFGTASSATAAAKLGGYAGLDQGAAAALLGIAGTGVLGGLRAAADDQKLGADGLLRELDRSRGDIVKALPAEFTRELQGAGLVEESLLAAPAAFAAAPVAGGKGMGLTYWIVGLVVLGAAGAWFVGQKSATPPAIEAPVAETPAPPAAGTATPAPEVPAPAAPAAESEPEPAPAAPAAPPAPADVPPAAAPSDSPPAPGAAPEATAPAQTGQAAPPVPANPLEVDGVDLGAKLQAAVGTVASTLGGVSDAASAEAAVGRLREVGITLDGMQGPVEDLPAEGRAALKGVIGSALPTLRANADRLLADATFGPILRPVLGDVMAKLNAYAG